jgi:hypothetical protein
VAVIIAGVLGVTSAVLLSGGAGDSGGAQTEGMTTDSEGYAEQYDSDGDRICSDNPDTPGPLCGVDTDYDQDDPTPDADTYDGYTTDSEGYTEQYDSDGVLLCSDNPNVRVPACE